MGVVVADRVDRPPSLFDAFDGPTPAAAPPVRRGGLERRLREEREASAPQVGAGGGTRVHGGVGGEPTLDEMIVGAWEGLAAQVAVQCPLCDGTLRPVYGQGDAGAVVAGHCDRCATTLS
jgi:hypothetical protein